MVSVKIKSKKQKGKKGVNGIQKEDIFKGKQMNHASKGNNPRQQNTTTSMFEVQDELSRERG